MEKKSTNRECPLQKDCIIRNSCDLKDVYEFCSIYRDIIIEEDAEKIKRLKRFTDG